MFVRPVARGLLVAVVVMAFACTANADVIYSAMATDPDPTTQGWTPNGTVGSSSVGAGEETIASNTYDYWRVADPADGGLYYTAVLGADVNNVNGWTATAVLRVSGSVNSPEYPVTLGVDDTVTFWNLTFYNGSGFSGEGPYRMCYPYTPIVTAMDVDSDYHIYQMSFNPATSQIGVYVDGSWKATFDRDQISGGFMSNPTILFGSASTANYGTANWTHVAFETGHHVYSDITQFSSQVPEPSTVTLLAMGAIGLLAYAWRKRK